MLRKHYLIKEKIKKMNQEPTKMISQSENGMIKEATRANGNINRSSGKKRMQKESAPYLGKEAKSRQSD